MSSFRKDVEVKSLSSGFYVYLHRKLTDGSVFYVGKGYLSRAWRDGPGSGRSVRWNRTVSKHGYSVDIYISGVQEWYAFEVEKELIAYYGRDRLCNLTDGGEGGSGIVITDAQKELYRKL